MSHAPKLLSVAGKLPPHELAAERAVLSACMLKASAFDEVATLVKPDDFYDRSNAAVFEAIYDLAQANRPIDTVQVASWLRDRNRLGGLTDGGEVTGPAYIANIVDATPAVAHVASHARIVAEKSAIRRVILETAQISGEAYNEVADYGAWSNELEARIARAVAREESSQAAEGAGDVLRRTFTRLASGEADTGLRTGIPHLDRLLNGMRPGTVVVIGARSHIGKSMLGRQIATHVAGVGNFRNRQGGVLVWSGEQDREETAMCMAYQYARLAEWKLKDKQYMTRKDWNDLTEAVADISAAPLWIIDQPEITPLRLRAEIRAVKRLAEKKRVQEAQQDLEYPPDERRPSPELKFVLVDYLQLMGSAGLVEKNANREREVSAISRKLKQIAASEKVVIALCAQLNKDGDKRGKDDSTPRNGDLRESNSIEQDADKIILIHNPHAAERAKAVRDSDERKDPEPEVARLIVGKARQGGTTGTVRTVFLPTCGRFEPYDGRHDPEAN